MSKNRSLGFTLIELLVVVAIIGILSAVVLASLSTARNKARDASVQASMSSMRTAAEIHYGNNNNAYGTMTFSATCASPAGVFADTTGSGMPALVSAVRTAAPAEACGASATAWVMAATMPSAAGDTLQFCVDSTGAAKQTTGTLAASYNSANLACN